MRTALRVLVVAVAVLAVAIGLRRYGSPVKEAAQTVVHRLRHNTAGAAGQTNTGDLRTNLMSRLAALETDTAKVAFRVVSGGNTREMRAAVPKGHPPEWMVWFLSQAANSTACRLDDCTYSPSDRTCTLVFGTPGIGSQTLRLVLVEAGRYHSRTGRMAVLVEDFGFKADQTTMDILSFPQPLTVAIAPMPGIADWTAQIAGHYHKEVAIYLPLEPAVMGSQPPKTRMIMVHYSEAEIQGVVGQATRLVPSYSGFCGYLGSRALEDSRVSKLVLTEVKNRRGYFVDTRSTAGTLARSAAFAADVPYRLVDDRVAASASEGAVDSIFAASVRRAQRTGSALLSAGPSAALTTVLKRRLPSLASGGITLVLVSDLVGRGNRRE